jgi:uncharacterized protein
MTVAAEIVFPERVRAEQRRLGSREAYAAREHKRPFRERVTPDLSAFLATIDTAFLGTAGLDGRPYIQHRGGPPGFIQVRDEKTLAFADFAGNRQYIPLANLRENDQVYLVLLDFASRIRVKIWGRARAIEDDAQLLAAVSDPAYRGRPERVIAFTVEAWDTNCQSHITARFTEADIGKATSLMLARIAALEAEVTSLKAQLEPAAIEASSD